MRLAQRRMLPTLSQSAMQVTSDLAGQVLVTPYIRLNKHYHCQTARSLAVVVPGQRFKVEVVNLSDKPVCLRKGTVIATVSPVDDVDCLLVTEDAGSLRRTRLAAAGCPGTQPPPFIYAGRDARVHRRDRPP